MNRTREPLALEGGRATFPDGPPSWPPADATIAAAVQEALRTGDWGRYHGHGTQRLAERWSELLGVEFVRLCASGTVAVELALMGLGVRKDDEIILAGYDFSGNFRCIEHVGARPVLVDIDPTHGCLDPQPLDAAKGQRTRAVIVSHLHSGMAPMRQIMQWAAEHGVGVIEDACQAPGGMVDGRLAGTWGDIGVFSFGGSKLLTAGRGGAAVTRRAECYQRMKIYSERGNDAYPLSELQAAALLPQLDRLAEYHARRQRSAKLLRTALKTLDGVTWIGAPESSACQPAYYKVGLWTDDADARPRWIAALQAEGVAVDAGFRGFHVRGPRRCRKVGDLNATARAASCAMVLHHPVLLESEQTVLRVADAFSKVSFHLSSSRGAAPPTDATAD